MLPLLLTAALAAPPVGVGVVFDTDADGAFVVTHVGVGAPADEAGLRPGDRLLTVDGVALAGLDPDGVLDTLAGKAGTMATLVVWRHGEQRQLWVRRRTFERDDLTWRTFGCVLGDCVSGRGLAVQPDGWTYEGTFVDGLRHGTGVTWMPDGRRHEGAYVAGQAHGPGTHTWPNGARFVGLYEGDRATRGTMSWPDGSRWEGPLLEGRPHGVGALLRADGQLERGRFEHGVRVPETGPEGFRVDGVADLFGLRTVTLADEAPDGLSCRRRRGARQCTLTEVEAPTPEGCRARAASLVVLLGATDAPFRLTVACPVAAHRVELRYDGLSFDVVHVVDDAPWWSRQRAAWQVREVE